MYEFEHRGKRHHKAATNEDGTPCKNRREADACERRTRTEAGENPEPDPKKSDIPDFTLAQAFNGLRPTWERQSGLEKQDARHC